MAIAVRSISKSNAGKYARHEVRWDTNGINRLNNVLMGTVFSAMIDPSYDIS
jgi:hypothetical protein